MAKKVFKVEISGPFVSYQFAKEKLVDEFIKKHKKIDEDDILEFFDDEFSDCGWIEECMLSLDDDFDILVTDDKGNEVFDQSMEHSLKRCCSWPRHEGDKDYVEIKNLPEKIQKYVDEILSGKEVDKKYMRRRKFNMAFVGLPEKFTVGFVAVRREYAKATYTYEIECDDKFDIEKLRFLPPTDMSLSWTELSESNMGCIIYDNVCYEVDFPDCDEYCGGQSLIIANDITKYSPDYLVDEVD